MQEPVVIRRFFRFDLETDLIISKGFVSIKYLLVLMETFRNEDSDGVRDTGLDFGI